MKKIFPKRRTKLIFAVVILLFIASLTYLTTDYYGPRSITAKSHEIWGMPCYKAKELIIQGFDEQGNTWATRGMVAYKQEKGTLVFKRQFHIPTGLSIYWLRNFSLFRRFTLRPECVELLPLNGGKAVAMSAGHIWYRSGEKRKFEKVLTLPHYGIGVGLGTRNAGLTRLKDGTILLGEYFGNPSKTNVRLLSSGDGGRSWQVAYDFPPGAVRHIHAVQSDPYSDKAWVLTGDEDAESQIAWSTDRGKTLFTTGKGSQLWRVCQLVFTDEAVFFGTDTGEEKSAGIYKIDRGSQDLQKLAAIQGLIYYGTRLKNGLIVMSTVREGHSIERDKKTRLWIIDPDERVHSITCGTRRSERKYAKLRFQREQGSEFLYVTCLDQKDCTDGDLLMFTEKVLNGVVAGEYPSAETQVH